MNTPRATKMRGCQRLLPPPKKLHFHQPRATPWEDYFGRVFTLPLRPFRAWAYPSYRIGDALGWFVDALPDRQNSWKRRNPVPVVMATAHYV
jgi:hypothetical protein